MIKLVFCARRREDLSRKEFHEYWFNHHAPLVRARAAALGAERYVQNHTVDTEINDMLQNSRGMKVDAYDGLAEIWWSDMDSFHAAMGREAAQRAGEELLADERNFVDFETSAIFLAETHVVVGD